MEEMLYNQISQFFTLYLKQLFCTAIEFHIYIYIYGNKAALLGVNSVFLIYITFFKKYIQQKLHSTRKEYFIS